MHVKSFIFQTPCRIIQSVAVGHGRMHTRMGRRMSVGRPWAIGPSCGRWAIWCRPRLDLRGESSDQRAYAQITSRQDAIHSVPHTMRSPYTRCGHHTRGAVTRPRTCAAPQKMQMQLYMRAVELKPRHPPSQMNFTSPCVHSVHRALVPGPRTWPLYPACIHPRLGNGH